MTKKFKLLSQLIAIVFFAFAALTSVNALAITTSAQKTFSINELVNQFYAQKDAITITRQLLDVRPTHPHPPDNCLPQGPTCLDAACQKLGPFGCDDIDEIQAVSRACRGNYDGSCLNDVCAKLGSFGCDDRGEIQSVARACVGNYDTSCFENVCRRLGSFGCDDLSEAEEVLRSCAGN